jgi:hypothetical protein
MAIDLSGFSFFIPIFSFVLVLAVVYGILKKTKVMGDSPFLMWVISFVIATIFVSLTSVHIVVENVIPWFALLIIALFFVMVLMAFSQGDINKMMKPWFGWIFVIILLIIFFVSSVNVFGTAITQYLIPGSPGAGADPSLLYFRDFFFTSKWFGAIILLAVGLLMGWILTKK